MGGSLVLNWSAMMISTKGISYVEKGVQFSIVDSGSAQ